MGNGWPINYRGNPLTVATKNSGLDAAPRPWSRVDDKKPVAKFHHGPVPIKMSTRSSVTQTGSAHRFHLNSNSLRPLLLLSFPFRFYFSFIPIPFLSCCFHLRSAISDPSYSPSFWLYQFFVFVRSYILLHSSFLCLYLWSFRDFQRHQFFILFNLLPFSFFPIPLFSHLHVVPMLPSFDYISIITRQLFFSIPLSRSSFIIAFPCFTTMPFLLLFFPPSSILASNLAVSVSRNHANRSSLFSVAFLPFLLRLPSIISLFRFSDIGNIRWELFTNRCFHRRSSGVE